MTRDVSLSRVQLPPRRKAHFTTSRVLARTGSGGVSSPPPARTMAATAESIALHRAVRLLDAETPPSDVDVEECRVAFKAGRGILANVLAYPPRRAEDRAAVRTTTVELRGGKSIRLDGIDIENALTLRCARASIPSIPSAVDRPTSLARRRRVPTPSARSF